MARYHILPRPQGRSGCCLVSMFLFARDPAAGAASGRPGATPPRSVMNSSPLYATPEPKLPDYQMRYAAPEHRNGPARGGLLRVILSRARPRPSRSVRPWSADGIVALPRSVRPIPFAAVSMCSNKRMRKPELFDHLVGASCQSRVAIRA